MHWCLSFVMLFVGVMFAEAAFAFSYSTCLGERLKWNSNIVPLFASPVSFPDGPWRTALTTAVDQLNLNPSQFRYTLETDTGGVRRENGQNEVWFSTFKGPPARAYTTFTCLWFFGFGDRVHMNEVDVVFNTGTPWSSSEIKTDLINYGGTLRPLHPTAIHEIGHGVRLKHVNTEYNVMGEDFTHLHVNGATARAYLGEDASDGAVFLYGTSFPPREDVGVVHWKYSGASGEYSTHTKTQLFTSFGQVVASVLDDGEPRYFVSLGQTVQAEFTYENNGANRQDNVAAGFYISTNDTITTGDQRIGGITLTLGRGDVLTTRATVTIPATLPDGDYWLGAIIDEAGAIDEIVEWNNATYIPIRARTPVITPPPIVEPVCPGPERPDLSASVGCSPDGVTIRVTNAGRQEAGDTVTSVSVRPRREGASDLVSQLITTDELGPCETVELLVETSLTTCYEPPQDVPGSGCFAFATADALNQVDEDDEMNEVMENCGGQPFTD